MLLRLALIALSLASVVLAGAAPTSTHLRFYMHDIVTPSPGNPVATAVRVVKGTTPLLIAPTSNFGDTYAVDDPLTEGPDAASPAVRRAQGFYMLASQTELSLLLSVNMVFTSGPRNGSTLAVLARDLILDEVRELPVVGGTGAFRGVTGYGLLRTHFFNASNDNAVLRIDMYLSV